MKQRSLIGVSLGVTTMSEAVALLHAVQGLAQIVELRLDIFRETIDLSTLLRERGNLPVIVTLRPTDQGGQCITSSAERLKVLLNAAELGAEYIDLEWNAAPAPAIQALHSAGARVMVSRHDFTGQSTDILERWWHGLAAYGADAVKVVGIAADARACLPVFRIFRNATVPTVAIAMGEAGMPSRILALREPQCLLTFGKAPHDAGTAPGQVPVRDLLDVYAADRLDRHTAAYGILAPAVEHTLAGMHNRWFAAAGLNAVAVPFPTSAGAAAIVSAYRTLPISGWHVHGESLQRDVPAALDDLEPMAADQGKVNAIRLQDGELVGAWVESPEEQFSFWTGLCPLTI